MLRPNNMITFEKLCTLYSVSNLKKKKTVETVGPMKLENWNIFKHWNIQVYCILYTDYKDLADICFIIIILKDISYQILKNIFI